MAQPAGYQTVMVGGYDGAALQAFSVTTAGALKVVSGGNNAGVQLTTGAVAFRDASNFDRALAVAPFLSQGAQTLDLQRTPFVFKPINGVALTAGTGATVWTPAAGKKVRLMGGWFSSSAAAALILADNLVATVIFPTPVLAAGGIFTLPPMGNGPLLAAANNVLKLDCTAGTTVTGCVFGTEE